MSCLAFLQYTDIYFLVKARGNVRIALKEGQAEQNGIGQG
jgi:hypothetical protein